MKTILNFRTILFLIALSFLPNFSQAQQDYKKELDIIFLAFQKQNYELIKPLLDDQVKINEKIPVGMNDLIIPQVMTQLPIPDSYKIIKTETIGKNKKITAEYIYKDREKPRLQFFTFNKEGNVIDLDILSDAKKVEAKYNGAQ